MFFGGIFVATYDGLARGRARRADELLAVPVAVAERRVDQVQAEVERALERLHGLVVLGAEPLLCPMPQAP